FDRHVQVFDLKVGRFQIQLGAQVVDGGLEECKGCALDHEVAAKFSVASVHCSVNGDLACKIASVRAKQRREIAKLIDRCSDVAAKVWTEPAGRARGKCRFTA